MELCIAATDKGQNRPSLRRNRRNSLNIGDELFEIVVSLLPYVRALRRYAYRLIRSTCNIQVIELIVGLNGGRDIRILYDAAYMTVKHRVSRFYKELLLCPAHRVLVKRGVADSVELLLHFCAIDVLCDIPASDRVIIVLRGIGEAETLYIAVCFEPSRLLIAFLQNRYVLFVRFRQKLCDSCLFVHGGGAEFAFLRNALCKAVHAHALILCVPKAEAVFCKPRLRVLTFERHIKADELHSRNFHATVLYRFFGSLREILLILFQERLVFLHELHFGNFCVNFGIAQLGENLGIETALVPIHATHNRHRIAESL